MLASPFGEYFAHAVQENKETTTANIFHALSKPIFRLYLAFLSYILDIMCKINMEFQAEKPKIHKLHNKMVSFYKILLWNYISKAKLCQFNKYRYCQSQTFEQLPFN
jgi:hypothetical protein